MNMRAAPLVFEMCVLLLGFSPAIAQTAAQPPAGQIIEKYMQALGGKAALEKVASRTMKGSMEMPEWEVKGAVEVYLKGPDKYLSISNVEDWGASQEAFSGEAGWTRSPDGAVSVMSRSDLELAKRDNRIDRDLKLLELYKWTGAGTAKVAGRDAWVLEGTPPGGGAEKYYFDAGSGLLLRRDFERVSLEEGIILNQAYYEDYRDVDGVKIPFTVRRVTQDYSHIVKWSEVRHNVAIEDSKFEKPAK